MTTASDLTAARQRVSVELRALADAARALDADPMWRSGLSTPQRWRQRGFHSALGMLEHEAVAPADDAATYFARVEARVRELRGDGPDLDDEGWYDSAIDDACGVLDRARRGGP